MDYNGLGRDVLKGIRRIVQTRIANWAGRAGERERERGKIAGRDNVNGLKYGLQGYLV